MLAKEAPKSSMTIPKRHNWYWLVGYIIFLWTQRHQVSMNSVIESVVHDYLKCHPAYYDGEGNNIDGEGWARFLSLSWNVLRNCLSQDRSETCLRSLVVSVFYLCLRQKIVLQIQILVRVRVGMGRGVGRGGSGRVGAGRFNIKTDRGPFVKKIRWARDNLILIIGIPWPIKHLNTTTHIPLATGDAYLIEHQVESYEDDMIS